MESTQHINKEEAKERRVLCFDVLNYSQFFFPQKSFWELHISRELAQDFAAAVHNNNLELHVFIDSTIQSEEQKLVWRKRVEKRIINKDQKIPPVVSRIVGDIFSSIAGVTVHYSTVDNDDTIASYAHDKKGIILSRDSDFMRYFGGEYQLYTDYKVYYEFGLAQLELKFNTKTDKRVGTQRDLIIPPPPTKNYYAYVDDILVKPYSFMRGICSALTLELGNPHILIRPLRQAFYHIIGVGKGTSDTQDIEVCVNEMFPIWDREKERVVWNSEEVPVSNDNIQALDSIEKSLDLIMPRVNDQRPEHLSASSMEWSNHLFGVCAIVSEMISHVPAASCMTNYDPNLITPIDALLEDCLAYLRKNGYLMTPKKSAKKNSRKSKQVKQAFSKDTPSKITQPKQEQQWRRKDQPVSDLSKDLEKLTISQ